MIRDDTILIGILTCSLFIKAISCHFFDDLILKFVGKNIIICGLKKELYWILYESFLFSAYIKVYFLMSLLLNIRNSEKRKEKSRDAARLRRNQESVIFEELFQLLPLQEKIISQMDKTSILRFVINYLRLRRKIDPMKGN